MSLVIFVGVSVLVMSVVVPIGNKYCSPIIRVREKTRYEMLNFLFVVLCAIFVAKFIDFEKVPVISGMCFGILESIVKIFVSYDGEE